MFTIAGIPVIYQGDEQLLTQSRQAMFAGGFGSSFSQFNRQQPMYRHIQSLATLRQSNPLFRRGDWSLLQADGSGPGILAYQLRANTTEARADAAADTAIVLLNTADSPRLLADLPLYGKKWRLAWQFNGTLPSPSHSAPNTLPQLEKVVANASDTLTLQLPPRATLVLLSTGSATGETVVASNTRIQFQLPKLAERYRGDFWLSGSVSEPGSWLQRVHNGELTTDRVQADATGRFRLRVPVQDFGKQHNELRLYSPEHGRVSPMLRYQTEVSQAQWQGEIKDPADDDHGPDGRYRQPQHQHSQHQMDVVGLSAQAAGSVLELTISMAQISQFWAPANGFDNVHFAIFFHLPKASQLAAGTFLPGLNQRMPQGKTWQLGHFMFGWGNSIFTAQGATATETGQKLGAAPVLTVEPAIGRIKVRYQGAQLGISDWQDVSIYLSTWDKSGEGMLRSISPQPSAWSFAGAAPDSPKVLDDSWLTLQAVD